MKSITVYCGSSTQLEQSYHDAAEVIGRGLGEKEFTLVYGGGRIGLMGEVATSAAKHGARVVGVITHKLVAHEQANESCDELIVVDTMQERRTLMMERGDAFIVLPGGIGTYEELFEVLVGRQLGDHAKPIGIVNVEGYFDPFIDMLNHGIDHKFIRDAVHKLIYINPCPENVLHHITSTEVSQPSPEDILPMHG
ncbi:TIGR00730 family Rossman fold protein [bacterium]|nr:TIGR00730 family Rossman fold protein [bacterium]